MSAGAQVEQNLWQKVIRKCSLPPAPPTGRDPKRLGFDNVLGLGRGAGSSQVGREEVRACNYSKHGPLAPRPRPRGPMPSAPTRESREKEAVEELVGSEEGAARAKRGPAVRNMPPPESPGPGWGPPGRTPRPALRFLEPSPRHLPF